MKYLLDFDETLFDAEKLKRLFDEHHIDYTERRPELLEELIKKIATTNPTFSFTDFLYPDAKRFLQKHGSDCIIVSSARSRRDDEAASDQAVAFQKEKIRLALGETLKSIPTHVTADEKSEVLRAILSSLPAAEPVLFVDDQERHLKVGWEHNLVCFKIVRGGSGGNIEALSSSEDLSIIRSLDELEARATFWLEKN